MENTEQKNDPISKNFYLVLLSSWEISKNFTYNPTHFSCKSKLYKNHKAEIGKKKTTTIF